MCVRPVINSSVAHPGIARRIKKKKDALKDEDDEEESDEEDMAIYQAIKEKQGIARKVTHTYAH